MGQLTFEWPFTPSYAGQDFIALPENAEALQMLDAWPQEGHARAMLLTGPAASGKTHLAHRWAARLGAAFIDPQALGTMDSIALWRGATHAVLENIETLTDEAALFHLLRHGETQGGHLLLTAGLPVAGLPFTLPDLRSRLRALPQAVLLPPSEAALTAFLLKYFSDRQMRVDRAVADYACRRLERSFAAAKSFAESVAKVSARDKRPVTVALVKAFLT